MVASIGCVQFIRFTTLPNRDIRQLRVLVDVPDDLEVV
jgi:hypothetical protein